MKATTRLKNLLKRPNIIKAPGVFDGMSAKLAERAGFLALYASGGAISRSSGYPDLGLLSFSEICDRLAQIVDVTALPVIADADTGYGNTLNVHRTIRAFERVGIAVLHLEDQTFPKRCGHLEEKTLVPVEEMVQKIKVAKDNLRDPALTLIARTDAIAVENFSQAIERAEAYQAAGADMVFVEAPESIEQIETIAKRLPYPKLINMFQGGKTPLVPAKRLEELGYSLMIIPSDLQRAAMKAMEKTLDVLYTQGDSSSISESLSTFQERELLVETSKYLALED